MGVVERDRQFGRPRGLDSLPPPPLLASFRPPSCDGKESADGVLAWQAKGLNCFSLPLSLLHQCMATSGHAQWFMAPSYIDVDDQQQVPPW
jgi:hypothetical protein